jgi:nitroreductase
MTNPVIETLLNRKSIRQYTDQVPSDEMIRTLAQVAQQAPFATQSCSLLLCRKQEMHPHGAPLLFTVCADHHKLERIMAKRNWSMVTNDLLLLLFGIEDACLMAQNLIIAAESLGLGSCCLGLDAARMGKIREKYKLPSRVLPVMGVVVGFPDETPAPRPRYPLDYFLFEDTYPEFTDEQLDRAMSAMDEGYLKQNYYKKSGSMITLADGREETFTLDNYGWTEHISRKWGQWFPLADDLLAELARCGFEIGTVERSEESV